MANLNQSLAGRKMPPGRVETLRPEAYLEECDGRPTAPVVIGLRTPNDEDYSRAKNAETDDEALMAIVSCGICDPNDCNSAHPSFPFPDIQIKTHLKPATVRYLYDQIELLHLQTSPIIPLATDEELYLLGDALQDGERLAAIEADSVMRANRIRRLSTALYDALGLNES